MRLGLLSDVHANRPALQAVLRALREQGAEKLLVAGDLVGYGGEPNECVEMLAEAGAECVAGNHDLFVLNQLPPTRFPPMARHSAEVTRSLLSADVRRYLGALPRMREVGPVLMAHGSPDSPEEYVLSAERAGELLRRLPVLAPAADILVLGHTHRQWCVVEGQEPPPARGRVDLSGGARLVNPGSVGQSRQRERRPGARFALYDTGSAVVEFSRVDYDVEAGRAALRRWGLPDRCLHAAPRVRDRAEAVARRVVRTVRARPGR